MTPVTVIENTGPVILAQPHSGTYIPDDIMAKLNPLGRELRDTDWHIPELYEDILDDASIVRANFSRYVIDPNRDRAGGSLYPGQNTTTLVPLTSFDGEEIWTQEPDEDEISRRLQSYHSVYHAALQQQIDRVKAAHGIAILYDCHSIRSHVPHLFDGKLPVLNIGNNSGQSCSNIILDAVADICATSPHYDHVVNGRFKGGWTTRHYGRPNEGVHSIQMELAQCAYLQSEEPPFAYDEDNAMLLRELLSVILLEIRNIAQNTLNQEN